MTPNFRPPFPVIYHAPRKRPPFVYRRRLHRFLALAACGVLGVLAGVFGDLSPDFTLAASLVTFAACVGGLVNLAKLRA